MSKLSKTASFLFKAILALTALSLISAFVIAKIGGSSTPLREGVEEFISQISGTRVVIEELDYMGFIPDVRIEIKNVTFQEIGDPTHIMGTMEEFRFSKPFIDHILNRHTVEKLNLKNLEAEAGFITKSPLKIETIKILDEEGQETPKVFLSGLFHTTPFSFEMDIAKKPHRDIRTLYMLRPTTAPVFSLGELEITGNLTSLNPGTDIKNLTIQKGNTIVMEGAGTLLANSRNMNFDGAFTTGQSQINLTLHSTREEKSKMRVTANIQIPELYQKDWETLKTLYILSADLPLHIAWRNYDWDGEITIGRLHWGGAVYNNIKGKITQGDNTLFLSLDCPEALKDEALCIINPKEEKKEQ